MNDDILVIRQIACALAEKIRPERVFPSPAVLS